MNRFRLSLLFVTFCLPVAPVRATDVINWSDSGWYNSTGFHAAANNNYITGFQGARTIDGVPITYNNYFVFDLNGVTEPVISATLSFFNAACPNCGYGSSEPLETYAVFDVSTPIGTLTSTQLSNIEVFSDLGSGVTFGSQTVSAADNGELVNITLNSLGIAAINSALGGSIAFGGSLTTLNAPSAQFMFAFSGNDPSYTRQLLLTAVPEPTDILLIGPGLLVIAFARHRRRRK